jgi:hypothetical protein
MIATPVSRPPDTKTSWLADIVHADHLQMVALIVAGSAHAASSFERARHLSDRVRHQLEIGAPTSAERTLRLLENEVIIQRIALGLTL